MKVTKLSKILLNALEKFDFDLIDNIHKFENLESLYSISIPIIGIGGISNSNDIIEFMLSGANFVQLGTINYKYPNLGVTLFEELKSYCKKNQINSNLL